MKCKNCNGKGSHPYSYLDHSGPILGLIVDIDITVSCETCNGTGTVPDDPLSEELENIVEESHQEEE